LRSIADRVGATFFDLINVVVPYGFLVEDIHWNTEGHLAVARFFDDRLLRAGEPPAAEGITPRR
jgi:hypothetical protein